MIIQEFDSARITEAVKNAHQSLLDVEKEILVKICFENDTSYTIIFAFRDIYSLHV